MKRFKKVYIEITNVCNLNCSFCIKNNRKEQFLTVDEFKIILKQLDSLTDYLYFHILGEPLMHPKINELIDLASNNFKINITTNGYLIDKIKDNKNIRQINISLHSYNENTMTLEEYITNIFSSIELLLKNNTIINFRLWANNEFSIEIIKYLEKAFNKKIDISKKNNKLSELVFLSEEMEFEWPDLNNSNTYETGKCLGLTDHFGILVDGTVIPCCLDTKGNISLGNIFSEEIEKIINNEKSLKIINGFRNNCKSEKLCKKCNYYNIRRDKEKTN